jgi:hypothetical protein
MKRFVMLTAVLVATFAATRNAQAQGKDLAGTWVLDVEKSGTSDGPKQVVTTLSTNEFTARMGGEYAQVMTFKLDGTEGIVKNGETIRARTKAAWKGNKLEATLIPEGRNPEAVTFSRDGAWLVVEAPATEKGPMKLYFKKAPPTN